mgnify:CR=1 FL=1
MFLKITKSKGYQYVRIVRSYWKDSKSRQEVVLNLGRLDILKQRYARGEISKEEYQGMRADLTDQ